MNKNKHITVIGSSNTDFVISTQRFAGEGETVLGHSYKKYFGGKGANQAVAAARIGTETQVNFIANLGADELGDKALENLNKEGINTQFVTKDTTTSSGIAMITVTDEGKNSIIVVPGSNAKLSTAHLDKAEELIKKSVLLIVQLEIPLEVVYHVLELGRKHNVDVILNPAPVPNVVFKESIYQDLFLITPNEHEASLLSGIEVVDEVSAEASADYFLANGVKNIIITLGARGAFFKNENHTFVVKAQKVNAVDTTGAGDIFNGAVAVALAESKNWKEAILFANTASSIGIKRNGAQASIPYRKEVDDSIHSSLIKSIVS